MNKIHPDLQSFLPVYLVVFLYDWGMPNLQKKLALTEWMQIQKGFSSNTVISNNISPSPNKSYPMVYQTKVPSDSKGQTVPEALQGSMDPATSSSLLSSRCEQQTNTISLLAFTAKVTLTRINMFTAQRTQPTEIRSNVRGKIRISLHFSQSQKNLLLDTIIPWTKN